MACIDPRGTVDRIYKEEYYTLLHIKYESSGPCGFGEEDFYKFSNCKSVGAIDPHGVGPFLTLGTNLQDLCKAPHNNAAYQK